MSFAVKINYEFLYWLSNLECVSLMIFLIILVYSRSLKQKWFSSDSESKEQSSVTTDMPLNFAQRSIYLKFSGSSWLRRQRLKEILIISTWPDNPRFLPNTRARLQGYPSMTHPSGSSPVPTSFGQSRTTASSNLWITWNPNPKFAKFSTDRVENIRKLFFGDRLGEAVAVFVEFGSQNALEGGAGLENVSRNDLHKSLVLDRLFA